MPLVITAVLLAAMNQLAAPQAPVSKELRGLDPRIPAADRTKYKDIRDAKDWLNPEVLVRADGIEVVSVGVAGGRKTVTADELRRVLIDLPLTAWPYGRVVLASDPSVRSGTRSEEEGIRRNHEAVEKILKALDILGDWWPSA